MEKKHTWADLHNWQKRVRRDILALEIWAGRQDPNFKPGGAPDQKGKKLDARIACLEEEWRWLFGQRLGDPGDPPIGPFE